MERARFIPRRGSDAAAAEEQAALRRVATLVASGAEAAEIFRLVAEEAGRLLGARSSATIRYDDGFAVTVGRWHEADGPGGFEVGTAVPLEGSPVGPLRRLPHPAGTRVVVVLPARHHRQ